MIKQISKYAQIAIAIVVFGCLPATSLQAQSNAAICQDGDCPSSVFSIQLDEPLKPESFSSDRTERFQQAYLSFLPIKNGYARNDDWQDEYEDSQLGGKSCLRHYQLEAMFAHEYVQNADFKKFVDGNAPNASSFVQDGFASSRKGLNLAKRMKDNCPKEVKDVQDKKGPSLDDFPPTYQRLGQELGYFDEKGKMLKPLDAPEEQQDDSKLNKKEQIAQLKQQVDQLPVGQEMKDKIGGVKNALGAARPKLGLLKGALGLLGSRLGTFLPGPLGLVGKIKTVNDVLGVLKNFIPKISVPNLLSKIGNLFRRGKDLGDKAKDLVDNSQKLKDKYDDISKKADGLQDKIAEREKAIDQLQNKLDELAKKKAELQSKLEDKPRKVLDELKKQVGDVAKDAGELVDNVEKETKLKDKLLEELDELTKAKEEVEEQLGQLEKKMEELAEEQTDLENETKQAEQEVEEVKKQEEKADELAEGLDDLKPETELEAEIADCEAELKGLLLEITGLDKKQDKFKDKLGKLAALPGKLLGKLSDLKLFQDKLKLPKNGIPVVGKILAKLDELSGKANAIGSIVEVLTGKKNKLQTTIEGYDKKLDNIKSTYDSRLTDLDGLKKELVNLIAEKFNLKAKLGQATDDAAAQEALVQDFIQRYKRFDDKSDCLSQKELEQKIAELKKEQETTEPELEKLEEDLEDAAKQEEKLEQQTKEVEKQVEEQAKQSEELKTAEETIKQEYGTDVKLEPVTVEEWAESFEVERPYWNAVFHPDDEVVEGKKGRYFEVQLKDADKNVKLLFGPGEYFLSKADFRKKYGSTIGAFVTEALQALKKTDQEKVKLYIQGGADIVGQETFSGNLDEQYLYREIKVLPMKADGERFGAMKVTKQTPEQNFRNPHLPNLRAQYLKEMILVYSKKFDPIVLEGVVKDFKDEGERNAIIYLFFPEEVLEDGGK
ncbi:MAG: hypothetical protein K9J37_06430 [Saprospiraceae bacterium]|nr:hypothetical protein [Saprospiraceae bacterium]MCF8249529.1 hypothetical protein [Saprospiraceae bacterium]MCF8281279.1 hypothetical protein [Bacteroidales bacterium]MCF8310747.1 hypothetical protein [Saprospiraceae bacterium]MCF8439422.1 hypothetical protein [Saprospiraceae bacterium]